MKSLPTNATSIVQQAKQELEEQAKPKIARGHATVTGSMTAKQPVQLEPLNSANNSSEGMLPKIQSAQPNKAQQYLEEIMAKKRMAKDMAAAKERKRVE